MRLRTLVTSFVLPFTMVFLNAACDDNSNPIPTGPSGWQESPDMYKVEDYTWVDVSSAKQLVGTWSGSKIIDKPAVTDVNPAYQLMVEITMIHVDSTSTLYVFKEDQYFNEAVKSEDDWTKLKGHLSGTSTGSKLNTNYPLTSAIGINAFYGTAATFPGVQFEKQYTQAGIPSFVTALSVKISTDGKKLMLQYSDDIKFVLGKP